MKKSWFLSVFALTVFIEGNYGSLVKINDTEYLKLPPLYALDDWARCLADDYAVYCMVDAELFTEQPAPLMELLQEYSTQTLKHYNHTQIHRGICVTRSCTRHLTSAPDREGLRRTIQPCLNETIYREYGLQARLLDINSCNRFGNHRPVDRADLVFAAFLLAVLLVNFLGTTYHMIVNKYSNGKGNRFLICFSIMKNWGVINFDRTKARQDSRLANLSGIEGLRVVALQGVIFSHVLFIYLYSYIDNPHYIEKMYDNIGTQATLNGPLWIQVFFSIGAFLLSYTFLIDMETRSFTWWLYLRGVVVRWIRLTPMAVFALGFTMTWFAHMGSGPQWDLLVTREVDDCRERWWYHLIYVHNHLETGKFCMGHTWYLAADFQLVMFGMLVMLLIYKYPRTVKFIFGGSMIAMVVVPFAVVYLNEIQPIITAQNPEAIRHLFLDSKTISQLYIPSYMNLSGYVFGLMTGYIHYHLEKGGIKLNENKLFNIIFHLSLVLCNVVIFTGCIFLSDDYHYTAWSAALYSALDRTVFAVFINIFLLGLFTRCKSALGSLMEWRGFQVLGRLTYTAYLMHFLVLRLLTASTSTVGHATGLVMLSNLVSTTVLTYAVSLPLSLMIEYPLVGLEKALSTMSKRTSTSMTSRTGTKRAPDKDVNAAEVHASAA